MTDQLHSSADKPVAPAAFKPSLAPGVRSQVLLPNATKPTGPGLSDAQAAIAPAARAPLGAPKPRLRAIEPPQPSAATSYKVQAPQIGESARALPVAHLAASGLAAAFAITSAILLFLKF